MSHGILINDAVVATEKTWHGLEIMEKKITFDNSRLNWEVEKNPIFDGAGRVLEGFSLISTPIEENKEKGIPANPFFPLTVTKGRYTPIQNKQIWEAMEKALEGIPHQITCVGSLEDRRKVFLSVRLTSKGMDGFEVNGDKFKANLNFLSSHDGSTAFQIFDSNVRVVCKNTFNMARSNIAGSKISRAARHTVGAAFKIDGIVKEIKRALDGRDIFKIECEKLAKSICTADEAMAFSVGMLFPAHREVPSLSVMQTARGIAAAFASGDGNKGASRYDLFNGVTQWFTRNVSREDSDVYSSSFIGVGATRKGEAFDLLTSPKDYKATVARGEKALALIA